MRRFSGEKIFMPKIAIPLILAIATALRIITLRYRYLLGYDPYFHLAYIEESLKVGYWIKFYPLANAPWGDLIYKTGHPLGFYATPVYIWKVLKISLYNAFRVTPVIFGVLTIFFFYLTILNFYGKREAFFSSFFLSVMFGHVFRSMGGYYRGDNYMLFWYSIALFGISLALRRDKLTKRLPFYLIPALASGLVSAFWSAYYLMFIFLLLNITFLAIGAFILKKERYLFDSVILALSTALGALIANYLGKIVRYGMLGRNTWLGKITMEKLGIKLNNDIGDVYLFLHLKYLVPLAILLVLTLFLTSKMIKNEKHRLIFVSLILLVFAIIFSKFTTLKGLFLGFKIFSKLPIIETTHSKFSDLWLAYNIVIFLAPLFVLKSRKVSVTDFLLLGTIIPSLWMIYIWTRFLFIGSMAIAIMAGVGLVSLYELLLSRIKGRATLAVSLILMIIMPSITGALGFRTVLTERPLMNIHWERGLVWLRENSNENDIILAWWDYGGWIEYYTRRGTVAQMSPDEFVARYLLGRVSDQELMNLGVDYIIVSFDTALKFGAILRTANENEEGQFLIILPLVSKFGVLIFEYGSYKLIMKPGKKLEVLTTINGRTYIPKEVFVEHDGNITEVELHTHSNLYAYINLNYGYAVLMNEKTFNTTLAKLMFTNKYPMDYKLAYSDGGFIKIFKFEHPNVKIYRRDGKIIFKFENATGTKLEIVGFLDNGTKVFEKWYYVRGLREFELPAEVKGDVIRYTYTQEEKVLDRGIFLR
ncbi:STT3 domain-containing protein [Pyrococcus sp. NA2]|uniref:STT3 domain-containing protein n=1 Tax=Pyrococcus sp. (strain NA2) TaxID=342949 RepID=UPI000B23EC5D